MSEIVVTGLTEVVTKLNRVHDTVMRGVKATMGELATEMHQMAVDFAPRDEYRLEESIRVDQTRDDRRYTQYRMTMGGIVDGVNVDQYATLMHENYEDIIVEDTVVMKGKIGLDGRRRTTTVNRREGSREKDAETRAKYSDPRAFVGGKFLERAGAIIRDKIDERVLDVVTEGTKE